MLYRGFKHHCCSTHIFVFFFFFQIIYLPVHPSWCQDIVWGPPACSWMSSESVMPPQWCSETAEPTGPAYAVAGSNPLSLPSSGPEWLPCEYQAESTSGAVWRGIFHSFKHIPTHTPAEAPYPGRLVEASNAGIQGMHPALTLLKVLGWRGNEPALYIRS